MNKKVGIPRGLFYYKYFPLWKVFLEELGAEIVLSDFTTKNILDEGVKTCVDEACLPIKIFHGHVVSLKDKVDFLFIPRFTSISKNEYICPKFGGLPDMVRHTLKGLPPIIDTEVDLRKKKSKAKKAAMEIGSYFSDNKSKVNDAFEKALVGYKIFRNKLQKGILPMEILGKRQRVSNTASEEPMNIVIIGHVYNIYDSYVNMDMMYKLMDKGVNVITVDMMNPNDINKKASSLNKRMFWNFGRKAVGGALYALEREDIHGIIYLMSFGCGLDSFLSDMVERRIRQNRNVPFTILTLDEHSGEAGLETRLEAFMDMVRWRKR